MRGSEVGYADATRQPLFLQRLHFLPYGLQTSGLIVEFHGGVYEEQVDVFEPQLSERLHECVPHGLALGRLGQLSRHEQLLAGFPRCRDASAEGLLVSVPLRAVEVREARVDRAGHQVLCILGIMRGPGAERQQRYRRAVIQFDWGVRHYGRDLSTCELPL